MTQDREDELVREIARLQGELDAERDRLDLVLQSIVDGVYMTDVERSIVYWNRGAERITGFRGDAVRGRLCKTLLAHTDEEGRNLCDDACPLTKTMEQKDPIYSKEVYTRTADGTLMPVSVSCAPLFDSSGNVVGAVEVFRDISAKKELERQKAALASMVTHDLKTPLMLILGYTELLLEMKPEDAYGSMQEFLKAISIGGNRLHSMIEDFLAISRIGAGSSMRVNRQPVIVEDLLNRLCQDFRVVADRKGLRLEYSPPKDMPVVELDITLMERALTNLIGNAVNYTPAGGTVSLSACRATLRKGCDEVEGISIIVSDTGPGIPEEELASVFEMYYRARGSAGTNGSGLGLAIVKAFVESHGGTVSAVSQVGAGTTFTVTLPVSRHAPDAV
ncbi:MAG: PAS domain-containing sensor histidine kinase [Nitrospirae bacterium]|nr:PAS domain-containing sensor histidine kinase [Nitrospirota bacterium]